MKLPEKPTYRDTLGPAVHLAMEGNREKCQEWFNLLVEHLMKNGDREYSLEEAENITKSNIGYYAGYYSEAERRAVAEMYGAMHPVFGNNFSPTPTEAFSAGTQLAEGSKK